jgi:putative transposase
LTCPYAVEARPARSTGGADPDLLDVAKLLAWMTLRTHSDTAKDIEILVLRHQLAVLRRRTPQPRMFWADRALTAALG